MKAIRGLQRPLPDGAPPHSVLLGMMSPGTSPAPIPAFYNITGRNPESQDAIQQAIDELVKENCGDAGYGNFRFNFKLIRATGAYICGEESALLSSIEGQRPEVRVRPPLPHTAGFVQQAHGGE